MTQPEDSMECLLVNTHLKTTMQAGPPDLLRANRWLADYGLAERHLEVLRYAAAPGAVDCRTL